MADKRKQVEILTTPDCYLRTRWLKPWVPPLAALLLLAGALSWLFFGSCAVTVRGWAQIQEGSVVDCAVPASKIDQVRVGQTMTVGNNSGPVTFVDENYVSYRQVADMYCYSVSRLHLSENETYYFVRAIIPGESTGYRQYAIITGTETPFEKYFGGKTNE